MQNIKELRTRMIENYDLLVSGERPVSLVKEVTNIAGKLMASVAIDLKYQTHMHFEKDIDYLYSKKERIEAMKEEKKIKEGK